VQQLARKGEELGVFKFGSTVVLLFQAPSGWEWNVALGDSIKMGQRLGSF
jgi:phosphatidylserine decarboxylase